MTDPDQQPAGELGYEQARAALVDIVRRLESGGESLEEALRLWERGEALADRCEQWLAGVQAKIDPPGRATDRAGDDGDGPGSARQ